MLSRVGAEWPVEWLVDQPLKNNLIPKKTFDPSCKCFYKLGSQTRCDKLAQISPYSKDFRALIHSMWELCCCHCLTMAITWRVVTIAWEVAPYNSTCRKVLCYAVQSSLCYFYSVGETLLSFIANIHQGLINWEYSNTVNSRLPWNFLPTSHLGLSVAYP